MHYRINVYRVGLFLLIAVALFFLVDPVWSIEIPNIGGSDTNINTKIKSVGGSIADTIAVVIGVISVLGIMVGGGFAIARKFQECFYCIGGSIVGLIIAGAAVGIGRMAS